MYVMWHVAGQVAYFSEYFGQPSVINLTGPIFIYTLLTDEAWDPYKKQCSVGSWGTLDSYGILLSLSRF